MFKWNRVLVALIGVPLLLFIYAGESFFRINLYGLPMLIFTNLVIGIGIYEFYKMIKISGKEVYDKFGIIVAITIPNLVYLSNQSHYSYLEQELIAVVLIVATIFMLTYRVFRNQIKGTLEKVSYTLLGIIYVSVFFSQIINLYFLGAVFPLILQVLVWVSDTSAGIVGVAIGRKFFKNGFTEISPKKSVEGALGSIIFTGLAFMLIVVLYIEKINGATVGEVFLSFIIGFYILIDLPNIRSRARKLIKGKRTVFIVKTIKELEDTFRQYVKSTFIVVILLCICQSLAFKISGLPSPLAFGFFCAFTNMIPYIGPYIGGIPAVVVGFTISPSVGVASLISVILCQFIESYLITPNIMSKTMKLHPVLIILGLSVGATFGIVGMIFATPIMACLRVIYLSVKGEFKWKSF